MQRIERKRKKMVDEYKLVGKLRDLIGGGSWGYDGSADKIDAFEALLHTLLDAGIDKDVLNSFRNKDDYYREYYDAALDRVAAGGQQSGEALPEDVWCKRQRDYPDKGSNPLWDFFNTL